MKKKLALFRIFWKVFPRSEHTETVFQKWPWLYLMLVAKLGSVRGTQMVPVLKVWRRGQWRAETWHYERPGEALGEGVTSVAVEGPGWKGSCREIETWHLEESLWEAIGESEAQVPKKTVLSILNFQAENPLIYSFLLNHIRTLRA